MKNPELNDSISDYSPADRAIIRASLNNARLANKKGSAKKAAVKPVAKKAAPAKKGSYQAGSAKSGKATYTTGSGVSRPTAKPAAKGMSNSTKAKIVGGAVAAGAVLLASRGKAGGLAAKLSPGLAKSGVGRVLSGNAMQVTRKASNAKLIAKDKALSVSGRVAAKTKKTVTQSQYDAMTAAAKSKPKTSTRGR